MSGKKSKEGIGEGRLSVRLVGVDMQNLDLLPHGLSADNRCRMWFFQTFGLALFYMFVFYSFGRLV
jgi:hypothetical protein